MQKNWINEDTSDYFRWYQNEQSGQLTEMYNFARNQTGKKSSMKWGLRKKKKKKKIQGRNSRVETGFETLSS